MLILNTLNLYSSPNINSILRQLFSKNLINTKCLIPIIILIVFYFLISINIKEKTLGIGLKFFVYLLIIFFMYQLFSFDNLLHSFEQKINSFQINTQNIEQIFSF